jgi:L-aspartate oxidase
MRYHYESIVAGSGIAGLTCAIHLKKAGVDVVVLTKNNAPHESNTFYAQGGIVAACPADTPEKLEHDILIAGCDYNNIEAVKH